MDAALSTTPQLACIRVPPAYMMPPLCAVAPPPLNRSQAITDSFCSQACKTQAIPAPPSPTTTTSASSAQLTLFESHCRGDSIIRCEESAGRLQQLGEGFLS